MAPMEAVQTESPQGIASVKETISFYGERINSKKKLDKFKVENRVHEDAPANAIELHTAKRNIGRLNETRSSEEKEAALAESELSCARTVAKQLALQIEESNAKVKSQNSELLSVKKNARSNEEDLQYAEVLQELDKVKQELRVLKLDMISAIEAKSKAEKEFEASCLKTKSYLQTVEELTREIDDANEEHVLVELARIEAERELRDINTQRETEAVQFAKQIEAAKMRIEELQTEIDKSKALETKLEATNADVEVLQSEMQFVRAMERNFQNDMMKNTRKENKKEFETKLLLKSAEKELQAAKKELASVKEEGFQVMTSMDLIRQELVQVAAETAQLVNLEKKVESTIQHLNSKLFKAKSKLESAKVADERAKAIVSNLTDALQQLQNDVQAAKVEKEKIDEETNRIKMEIDKTDIDIYSTGERLEAAVQQLEKAKLSEVTTLKRLRNIVEKTAKARAAAVLYGSTITISKSEHDYLRQNAAEAKAVAQQKLEASLAWVQTLIAEENKIRMKTELIEKEIRDLRAAELQQFYETDELLVARKSTELELQNLTHGEEEENDAKMPLVIAKPRKSTRGVRIRRISAPNATKLSHSSSIPAKKTRIGMPNLAKFRGESRNLKAECIV